MNSLLNFLKTLFLRAPQEILVALLKLIILILLFLPILLLRFWDYLLELLRRRNLYPEEQEEPCGRLPEAIIRRPDPAIYSQRLLQSQGTPVTWNNPDIWVTRADNPANIEPDSYHLIEDTDYIVSVRVHNASTDAAIGVRVRLNYRPWSFNSPDLVPAETDTAGNEVFRFVNVAPMSATVAQFNWHTPELEPDQEKKHFCLQASLFHALDVNTANNMGQENTNVWSSDNPGTARAGQTIDAEVPLFNYARRAQEFRFAAVQYRIEEEEEFELELKTTLGYAQRTPSQRLANISPSLQFGHSAAMVAPVSNPGTTQAVAPRRSARPKFSFVSQPSLAAVKNRYVGFEKIKEAILSRDYSLPDGMTITADGQTLAEGIEIDPKIEHSIRFAIKVPDDALPGSSYPITLIAQSADGVLAGGVTMFINVEEGS
jgi:hypothetical protein